MKKIITTIIILLVMYFIVDRMGGMAIRWAYNHSATDAKLKTIVEKIEVEIVLMGSSKTEDHFIPQVFEDSLGMSTYNCGLVGCMDIYYQYALLNLMLERYTPKMRLEIRLVLIDHSVWQLLLLIWDGHLRLILFLGILDSIMNIYYLIVTAII